MKLLEPILVISNIAVFRWPTASLSIRFNYLPSLPKKITVLSFTGMFPAMLLQLEHALIAGQGSIEIDSSEQLFSGKLRPMRDDCLDHFKSVVKASMPMLQ